MVVGLRDRPAALRQVRRRARSGSAGPLPARVHRRRRLPYAQPEGRPRHERLHAGRLQSGMETGVGAARAMLAADTAYLFGRTPGHRRGTDRLRSEVGQNVQRSAERSRRSPTAKASIPRSSRTTSSSRGASRRERKPATAPSIISGRADLSASRRRLRDRHALSFGAGRPSGRREAGSPGPRGQGRRPLATIRLRRRGRPRRPVLAAARSVRVSRRVPQSPVRRYTPTGADIDFGDRCPGRFPAGPSRARDRGHAALCCLPAKGRYGLRDYEKMFCPDLKNRNDIFDLRGIDRNSGCMVDRAAGPICRACSSARRPC